MSNEIDRTSVPDALRELWAIKDAIYQEVAHLPIREQMAALSAMAGEACAHYPELRVATPEQLQRKNALTPS